MSEYQYQDPITYYDKVPSEKRHLKCTLDKDENFVKSIMGNGYDFLKHTKPKKYDKLDENTYEERNDDEWIDKATEWKKIKETIYDLQEVEKIIREELISMCENNTSGGGIKVSKHVRKSQIDYSSIPELKDIDLERYRKEPVEYWRII